MDNLKEKIDQWRAELIVTQDLQEEVVDELEDHLRQKMDELSEAKLSDEDKFILAKTRLGHPNSLCNEFEKLNGHAHRLRQIGYMIGGYLLFDTALKMIQLSAKIMAALSPPRERLIDTATMTSTVYIVTSITLLLALFYCLLHFTRAETSLHNNDIFQKLTTFRRKHPYFTIGAALFGLLSLTIVNQIGLPLFSTTFESLMPFGMIMVRVGIYEGSKALLIPILLLAILLWVARTNNNIQSKATK